jgi:hypothetical protein
MARENVYQFAAFSETYIPGEAMSKAIDAPLLNIFYVRMCTPQDSASLNKFNVAIHRDCKRYHLHQYRSSLRVYVQTRQVIAVLSRIFEQ